VEKNKNEKFVKISVFQYFGKLNNNFGKLNNKFGKLNNYFNTFNNKQISG